MKATTLQKIIEKHGVTSAQLNAIVDQIQHPQSQGQRVSHYWGSTHTRIGLLSDLHIGSKYTQYGVLEDVFKRFKADHVEAVYIAGDITEGYNRRKGHSFECELHGADAQVQGVVQRLPVINAPIYAIGGDHDYWHYESAGVNVIRSIAKERADFFDLGMFDATIELSSHATLALMHPATGTAYAISYKPQKIVEALSGGEKPSVLAVGHFHKVEYLFYRNIHVFQTGCIQSQTPWMRRMNLSAHLGAWIVDIYTKKRGDIDKLETKLLPYY